MLLKRHTGTGPQPAPEPVQVSSGAEGRWNPKNTTTLQAVVSRTGRSQAGASTTPALPHPPRRAQGLTQAPAAPWPARCGGALGPVFLAILPMASASLCCPIRRVVVLVPSGSSKPATSARLSLHFGSRGRAVQKPRLMPLRTAQAVARQLQARHIGLVAVL